MSSKPYKQWQTTTIEYDQFHDYLSRFNNPIPRQSMRESRVTQPLIYELYFNVKRNTRTPIPERSKMDIGVKFVCAFNIFFVIVFPTYVLRRDDTTLDKKAAFLTGSTTTLRMHIAR